MALAGNSNLRKKHSELIYSEELALQEIPLFPVIEAKLNEILLLTHRGTPRTFAVLCTKDDPRLKTVLKTVSPFAGSVSLVTDHAVCPEYFFQDALEQYGLGINHREITQLNHTDLTLLLSGDFKLSCLHSGCLVNLSPNKIFSPVPMLCDIITNETNEFFSRHPNLRLKHFPLIPQNSKITNLIWRHC